MKTQDEIFMKRALNLAVRGRGYVSPNPLVGCVIVKDNRIIAEGWHKKFGEAHAEVNALNYAHDNNIDVTGATLYVNLEPCSHYGKTPPCAFRIVKEGIKKVVIAMKDINPLVNGKGIKILKEAGIEIVTGVCEREARYLNKGFISAFVRKRPYITLKAAVTLDGKLATKNGDSKWITGLEARTEAHKIRSQNDGVLVGVNTILYDDPELTVRLVEGVSPKRIILDARLNIPSNSKVFPCVILTSENESVKPDFENKVRSFEILSSVVKKLPCENGNYENIDLKAALEYLTAEHGILNLMVEGGGHVIHSFIAQNLADEIKLFIAPKILGEGLSFSDGIKLNSVADAYKLDNLKTRMVGDDVLIEGEFQCSRDLLKI